MKIYCIQLISVDFNDVFYHQENIKDVGEGHLGNTLFCKYTS